MRNLGSGSAILADADRKPCGEDVFSCVQVTVVACSAVRARPCPDLEAGHALRPGLRPAVGADLRARIIICERRKQTEKDDRRRVENCFSNLRSGAVTAYL